MLVAWSASRSRYRATLNRSTMASRCSGSARMISLRSSMRPRYSASISSSAASTRRAVAASCRTSASSHDGEAAGHRHRVFLGQRDRTLADIRGEVADAFQLAVDLDDRDEEAQVARHRLVERQDLEALLLDVDLLLVDQDVGHDHPARLVGVAILDGLEGQPQVVLHQGAESEDLALEPVDLALQMCHGILAAQPKRPVMYSSVCFSAGLEKIFVVGPNSTMRPWKKKAV